MNDIELADKVVELSALRRLTVTHRTGRIERGYSLGVEYDHCLSADEAIRDWRVAGALMEKMPDAIPMTSGKVGDDSLPRAIIEACVEALTNDMP